MINIFVEEVNIMLEAYKRFAENGLYMGLFLLTLIYFFVHIKEYKNEKMFLGIYPIVILLIIWNPLVTKILVKFIGESVYWRVYWLLPIGISIAYVFTKIIFNLKKKFTKIIACIAILIIVFVSGEFIYTEKYFKKVDNYYKVPDNILEIILAISEDNENHKSIAGPEEFLIYTRQINGTIKVAEYRDVHGNYAENSIINRIKRGEVKQIAELANKNNWNYLIYPNNVNLQEEPEKYGFTILKQNEMYTLYKLK